MENISNTFYNRIFQRYTHISISKILYIFLILLALIINIIVALRLPTFLHPDEVYQTLEIAHKLVYGYGIVTWDWQLNSWQPGNYGGVRSLLTPLIFSLFFYIGNSLNLNYWNQTLPLIRVLLIINFMFGLYITSKILREIDPDPKLISDKVFIIFSLFYQDFLFYGSKTITNTLVTPIVFFPLFIWVKKNIEERQDKWALEFIGGFFVGVSLWLRPDTGIVMAFFVLLNLEKFKFRKVLTFGVGFLVSAVLNGYLDLLYYGKFFVSFFNFLDFNMNNQSLFGINGFGWYFNTFILQRGTFFYLFALTTILISSYLIYYVVETNFMEKNLIDSLFLKRFKILIKLVVWTFLVLFFFEAQPHKEDRFMITWEIVYLILGSYVFSIIAKYIQEFTNYKITLTTLSKEGEKIKEDINSIPKISLLFIVIVLAFPFMASNTTEVSNKNWNNFNDVLESFVWVGQQNVTGVGIVMRILYTGGYSYLHKDVPIYYFEKPFYFSTFLPKISADNHEINYFIIPKYRYSEIPNLYNATIDTGFKLVHVISNSCDIYYIN